jgi:hypothetical protein
VADANRAAAHCPVCSAEYRVGFEVCADDGSRLEPGPARESARPEEPKPTAPEIPLFSAEDPAIELGRWQQVEADLLVAKLRSQGVDALDERHFFGFWYRDLVPEFSLCRIWVRRSDVERARDIVRHTLAGEDAI